MEWVIAAIVVVLIGIAAVVGTGAFGQMRPEPVRDVYRQPLPDQPLSPADLDAVRFGVTVRGYSMRQVDELLDRLRDELVVLHTQLAEARTTPDLAVEEPDPFAEYGLDGGQGLPEGGDWYDGDGRPGLVVEDEPAEVFRQFPAVPVDAPTAGTIPTDLTVTDRPVPDRPVTDRPVTDDEGVS